MFLQILIIPVFFFFLKQDNKEILNEQIFKTNELDLNSTQVHEEKESKTTQVPNFLFSLNKNSLNSSFNPIIKPLHVTFCADISSDLP
jgi:hypothetical protein